MVSNEERVRRREGERGRGEEGEGERVGEIVGEGEEDRGGQRR